MSYIIWAQLSISVLGKKGDLRVLCKSWHRYIVSWLAMLSTRILDSSRHFAQLAKFTEYGLCEVHIFCNMVIFACCTGDCVSIEYRGWSGRVPEYLTVAVFLHNSLSSQNMDCVRYIFSAI